MAGRMKRSYGPKRAAVALAKAERREQKQTKKKPTAAPIKFGEPIKPARLYGPLPPEPEPVGPDGYYTKEWERQNMERKTGIDRLPPLPVEEKR